MNDKADFTQGSILKKLIAFMIPVLGALILQAAYGAVDLLVVGRFGSTSGLSAVSTGSQVLNLVTFVVTQFAMGITVLIARYLGANPTITINNPTAIIVNTTLFRSWEHNCNQFFKYASVCKICLIVHRNVFSFRP